MPYVVTQPCCSDASCVLACPVNCIHPAPGEPGFAEAEMLYVDPAACVDCGACTTACPVDALKPHTKLADWEAPFLELNRRYYQEHPHADRTPLQVVRERRKVDAAGLRVAIVGAGPAGLYAADELLKYRGAEVDVFDRLPSPYGLARAGVAPDHRHTRQVTRLFEAIERQQGFRYRLNAPVGETVRLEDLQARYHAVLYAVGASSDRRLGIAGEDLPGSLPATRVVGWYNGHPDHRETPVRLDHERVVIVGNGNVALDVARILTRDPDSLIGTDIAGAALAALRGSRVREVVVLGRRGPAQAAFTVPELVGLAGLVDAGEIDVVVEHGPVALGAGSAKERLLAGLADRPPTPGRRRIVLRFCSAPVEIRGEGAVSGVEVERTELRTVDGVVRAVPTGEREFLPAGMVLRSVGYRGEPVADLPFDDERGVVPNEAGRVRPGLYVAGWIKRGPTGFLGTNKTCAEETVESLLDDLQAGRLRAPAVDRSELDRWFRRVVPAGLDLAGWRASAAASSR